MAYTDAQTILNASWDRYNSVIIGYEEWRGGNATASSRPARPDGKYPPRVPRNRPNGQNSFYDYYDIDDYFHAECVVKGQGLNAHRFPGGPLSFRAAVAGFYYTDFPSSPVC